MLMCMDVTDDADRVNRIVQTAEAIFGSRERARAWLHKPHGRLDGRTPFSLLESRSGSHSVEELLWQIDEGMFV
jgi:putative toxin-antitoxin system antitoxin component (TIGR02293 family)